MSNIDYLKIFRDAWKITWSNKFLWWFGLFFLLPGVFNSSYTPTEIPNPAKSWQNLSEKLHVPTPNFFSEYPNFIFFILGFLFILFLISLILSLIGQGAIIKSVQHILKNKPADFRSGWKNGKKYFWKMLSILFFSGLAFALCTAILFLPIAILFYTKAYLVAIPLAILAVLIIIPLLVLYKFLQTYACFYAVLADLTPWAAIESAYILFKKNILSGIIMALLFIPLGIFSFLLIIAIALIILIIFGLIGLILFFIFKKIGIIIAAVSGLIIFIFASILLYSIFASFSQVAWVLFFHTIAAPKEEERVAEKIKEPEKELTHLPAVDAVKTVEVEK